VFPRRPYSGTKRSRAGPKTAAADPRPRILQLSSRRPPAEQWGPPRRSTANLAVVAWPVGQELRAALLQPAERGRTLAEQPRSGARARRHGGAAARGDPPARSWPRSREGGTCPSARPYRGSAGAARTIRERPVHRTARRPRTPSFAAMIVTLDTQRMREAEVAATRSEPRGRGRGSSRARGGRGGRSIAARSPCVERCPPAPSSSTPGPQPRRKGTASFSGRWTGRTPFLEQEGVRDGFRYSSHGCALDVQVIRSRGAGLDARTAPISAVPAALHH
jgi:hypothetical protein